MKRFALEKLKEWKTKQKTFDYPGCQASGKNMADERVWKNLF